MNAFFEKNRQTTNTVSIQRNRTSPFPRHFHNNLEIYLLQQGKRKIHLNGKTHVLTDGMVAFFDSFDIHGYEQSESTNNECVVIIPYGFLDFFNGLRNSLSTSNNIIHDPKLCANLMEIADRLLSKTKNSPLISCAVNLFLTYIYNAYSFNLADRNKDDELIRKILTFLDKNFKSEISLSSLSSNLGYSKEHISRIFHKYFNIGIPQYINDLRLNYFNYLSSLSDNANITELIYQAGFNSIQSFYRNKARSNKIKK